MKWRRRYSILVIFAGILLIIDQWTKIWIHTTFQLGEVRPIIPGFLDLHYIRNTGAAFGFLSGTHSSFRIPFFIGISLVAIGIILFLFRKLEDSMTLIPLSLSLVLGGALGNLIDRIRLGEVIDFILVHYRWFHWPAFNVADIAITSGVILLMYQIISPRKQGTTSISSPS
jgi:signal peptidase II